MTINENGIGFSLRKIMSCDIPETYDTRTKWLRVFDMVSFLVTEFQEQNELIERRKSEHDGVIEVDQDSIVHKKISST